MSVDRQRTRRGDRPKSSDEGRAHNAGRKHDWIANQLRRVYDDALQEEIPDDMLDLLKQLDERKPDGEDGA